MDSWRVLPIKSNVITSNNVLHELKIWNTKQWPMHIQKQSRAYLQRIRLNFKLDRVWRKTNSWFENHFFFFLFSPVYIRVHSSDGSTERLSSRVVWTRYLVSMSTPLSCHDLNDFKKEENPSHPREDGIWRLAQLVHVHEQFTKGEKCKAVPRGNCEISTKKYRSSFYAAKIRIDANFFHPSLIPNCSINHDRCFSAILTLDTRIGRILCVRTIFEKSSLK